MRRYLRRHGFVLVLAVAVAAGAYFLGTNSGSSTVLIDGTNAGLVDLPPQLVSADTRVAAEQGAVAPDFILPTTDDGVAVRLSDFRGRPVLVNFWATWCGPCRREMPDLVRVHQRFADAGLVVIGVNIQESPQTAREFADEFGVEFPVALDLSGEITARYLRIGAPNTIFVDRTGVITRYQIGEISGEDLAATVAAMLRPAAPTGRIQ